MEKRIKIDKVWWRNVQLGEFYNIERDPKLVSGGGSLYIEIPSSLVEDTLLFLGVPESWLGSNTPIKIHAASLNSPTEAGVIEFQSKNGGRMRIARQNRKQRNSIRHPAWTEEHGFPKAPDGLPNEREAYRSYFPDGGLRIYIIKSVEGEYFAGFTKGHRPEGLDKSDPNWDLYPESSRVPGGIISAPMGGD